MHTLIATTLLAWSWAGLFGFGNSDTSVAKAVSPDGKNEIRLYVDPLAYEVLRDGEVMVARSPIDMKIDERSLANGAKVTKVSTYRNGGKLSMPVYKKGAIDLTDNETRVEFDRWMVRLAARNDGVAYRFETMFPGEVTVFDEDAAVEIPSSDARCLVYRNFGFGSEERVPDILSAEEVTTSPKSSERHIYLPFVYEHEDKAVAVVESDVYDYPILNFTRDERYGDVRFDSIFAKWPTEVVNNKRVKRSEGAKRMRHWLVAGEESYLVKTAGTRTYPWRAFILADSFGKLYESDLIMALARPQSTRDFSFVKPGKVAWDWWNAFDNLGDPEGCTTETYLRFVDFASANHVEYVILDEGWSKELDIWHLSEKVDLPKILDRAKEKNVGIILWMAWAQVEGDEARVAEHFGKMGVKGFKVDFMDRGDAQVERFLWKFADECAKRRLVIDYHGAHRPTGMSRAYPNVLNYEGVYGLETMKWFNNQFDYPAHEVKTFFGRQLVGPHDYTPGAMDNYKVGFYPGPETNKPHHARHNWVNPGSVGTRVRQMALIALYEAPLQMLADSPTKYQQNQECLNFMAGIPTVWEEVRVLDGDPETHAAVARRAKDGSWYLAAISNSEARELDFDLSFLGVGEWQAEIFRDAADGAERPRAYEHLFEAVQADGELSAYLAPAGGIVVKFTKK